MSNNRRDFLKKTTLLGMGIAGAGSAGCTRTAADGGPFPQTHRQTFNMSGYAAPKIDVVRIGIIGLGNRGTGTVRRLASIEGVEIRALCDLEPERVQRSVDNIRHLGHNPDTYSGHEDEWKKVCERPDLDLIAIVTPWHLHTPMCVFAMEHDKHAYTELPAATTMEECWKLVETSERTRKHCVQMSANCHDGIGAVILNMVREGFFGDLIHAEGCYIHDLLLGYNFTKHMYHNMWRLNENIGKSGNLYPQHGIVPIIQMMDINYGDKMDYLVSVSSNDFMMGETAKKLAGEDDFWQQYVGKDYRGNMNVTIFRTVKGRTIALQHDVTSTRPRGGRLLSGTRCIYQSSPNRLATSHSGWLSDEEFNSIVEKYTPEITIRFAEWSSQAEQVDRRGHSYFRVTTTDWRLIDCLRNGLPMDMDVYEAAVSSAVTPLSIWSVANRSNSVTVPDFTCGKWETNKRGMDIQLKNGGGNTKLV
jgi:hypothetical protein